MKYCSIEDDDCSHKSSNCIKHLLKINKPFDFGCVFKSHGS